MAQRNFTQFELRQTPLTGDFLVGYKSNATAEIRTSFQNIIDLFYASEPRGYQGFSLVRQNSAVWDLSEETYTNVFTNSSTQWAYQGTDLKELSGNWQNTYLSVLNNAGSTWAYQGTDLKELSGNWQNTYTTVNATSGNIHAIASFSYENLNNTTYQSFTNNIDNLIPFNTQLINTNQNVFELVNNRIYIKTTGLYEINSFIKFRDMHSNVVMNIKLQSSLTQNDSLTPVTQLSRDIGTGISEEETNKAFLGHTIINVTTPAYYAITVNPNKNSPNPSNTDLTPSKIFIKKLYN